MRNGFPARRGSKRSARPPSPAGVRFRQREMRAEVAYELSPRRNLLIRKLDVRGAKRRIHYLHFYFSSRASAGGRAVSDCVLSPQVFANLCEDGLKIRT